MEPLQKYLYQLQFSFSFFNFNTAKHLELFTSLDFQIITMYLFAHFI